MILERWPKSDLFLTSIFSRALYAFFWLLWGSVRNTGRYLQNLRVHLNNVNDVIADARLEGACTKPRCNSWPPSSWWEPVNSVTIWRDVGTLFWQWALNFRFCVKSWQSIAFLMTRFVHPKHVFSKKKSPLWLIWRNSGK